MPVLVTADLHLSDKRRDAYRHAWQKSLRSLVKRHKVSAVIIAGDLTEEKDRHSAQLVNQVADHLAALAALCDVYVERGNHDGKSPDNPFFEFVKHIPNIKWFSTPTACELPELGWCLFLPHTSNYEADWKDVFDRPFTWAFAHNTFAGTKSEAGFELEGIPTSVFPQGLKVISGDIHTPQKVGPVTYVGAPYWIDFGDKYDPRCLLLEGNKIIESIPYAGPSKVLLEMSGLAVIDRFDSELIQGDVIKVRVSIKPEDRDLWPEMRRKVAAWADAGGYTLDSVSPVIANATSKPSAKVLPAASRKSDHELITACAKRNRYNKATLATGKQIADEES